MPGASELLAETVLGSALRHGLGSICAWQSRACTAAHVYHGTAFAQCPPPPTCACGGCRPADLFALRQAGEADEALELQVGVLPQLQDLRVGGCVLLCQLLLFDACAQASRWADHLLRAPHVPAPACALPAEAPHTQHLQMLRLGCFVRSQP